jgi:hypothetical protein
MPRRLKYMYIACILALLVGVQVFAQAAQIASGYRPLTHAPARVPFSWDMFAIKIERCAVGWEPPLWIEGSPVKRWRDRSAAIEFDTVYDEAAYYDEAAAAGCAFKTSAATATTVTCASSDGEIRELRGLCP